jgi:hypothetical protein
LCFCSSAPRSATEYKEKDEHKKYIIVKDEPKKEDDHKKVILVKKEEEKKKGEC